MTTLVLLPGMDGTGLLFGPLRAALPPGLTPRVVAYPSDVPLGYDGLDPVVEASLPADGPFLLLGESFSGPLALRAAARRPRGLAGVILVATFAVAPYPAMFRHLVRPWMFRVGAKLRNRALLGRDPDPAVAELLTGALARVSPEVLARRVRAVLTVDETEALRACPVPVLTLRGTKDRVVPRRCREHMSKLRPDLEAVALDAPHLVLQTRPRESAGAIAVFLEAR